MKNLSNLKENDKKLSIEERKKILINTQIDNEMSYSERLAQLKRRYGVQIMETDIEIAGFFIAQIGEKTIKIEIKNADDVMAIVPICNNIVTITKK